MTNLKLRVILQSILDGKLKRIVWVWWMSFWLLKYYIITLDKHVGAFNHACLASPLHCRAYAPPSLPQLG